MCAKFNQGKAICPMDLIYSIVTIRKGKIINETPNEGYYNGKPVKVVPVIENNEIIAAIGVIDTTNGIYSDIMQMTRRPEENKSGNSRGEFY